MKKFAFIFALFTLIGTISIVGCKPEDEEDPNADPFEKLEGTWLVDENETPISKAVKDYYQVYISKSTTDSTAIVISNFYNLGTDVEYDVTAKLTNKSLRIDAQGIGNVTPPIYVEGNGTISGDYKSINFEYTVDPGTGVMQVTALYTKQ